MKTVPLAEVVGKSGIIIDGDWVESKDQNPDGDVRLIQLADIGVGRFLDKSRRYMDAAAANRLRCTYLRAGDLLIARMPDPIGRACIFPGSNQASVTVVDVCVLRPDLEIADVSYLQHVINADMFQQMIERNVKGSTRQRISRKNLEVLEIPLPPLDEQRRIAAILDQADALRRKRREASVKLRELIRASFVAVFGDPIANPRGWPVRALGEVGELERGVSKHRPRNDPALLGGAYPLIQTGDIANADGILQTFAATYSEAGLRQSRLWPRGTLCITIAANIGKTAILNFDSCFPDSVVGFVPSTCANSEYIQYWMTFIQKRLEEEAPESAQKNINLAILRALPVPIPPMELQDRFRSVVHQISRMKETQRSSSTNLDTIFASLQHRAFLGKL